MTDTFDRNKGLCDEPQQAIYLKSRLLIAGCGLGSQIAIGCARLGVGNYVLVDADKVDNSNLNRQDFTTEDIGKHKVAALSEKLKKINDSISTEIHEEFVTLDNVAKLLGDVTIVIDTIDPLESPKAVIALHREANKRNIPIVYPIDIGWGGGVVVFKSSSDNIESMIGIDTDKKVEDYSDEILLQAFMSYYQNMCPEYMHPVLAKLGDGSISHLPQPITSSLSAACLSTMAVKMILDKDETIKTSPEIISFDPLLELNK